jgi:hypothetical protein
MSEDAEFGSKAHIIVIEGQVKKLVKAHEGHKDSIRTCDTLQASNSSK